MTKIVWDEQSKHFYETGVDHGVLYPMGPNATYPLGVAWNGLTAVTESPSGAEANPLYADNQKYLNLVSAEEFGGTIEAYTYPDEFAQCDGSVEPLPGIMVGQQSRKQFGLCYRTRIGNDVDGDSHGYKLHLIYGCLAAPSERAYATVNDSPEAITFSWELTTTPVAVTGLKTTACLIIDSTKVSPAGLAALEDILFGLPGVPPRMPLPDEVISIVNIPPAAPDPLALSVSDPLDGAAAVAVNKTITLTFNNALQSDAIDNVVLVEDDGTVVPCTNSLDPTKKIMTVNPNSDLSAGSNYLITIAVTDIYGSKVNLANNFATAA